MMNNSRVDERHVHSSDRFFYPITRLSFNGLKLTLERIL